MQAALARSWLAALVLGAWLAPAARPEEAAGRKQEIVLGELPERTVGDAPFVVAAKASSGLPVTLEVVGGPAVLDGKKIRLTGLPGLVVIRATQPGNSVWLAAREAVRAFTVRPRPAAPVFTSSPTGREAGIGEHVVLTADATGEPAPALQWQIGRAHV